MLSSAFLLNKIHLRLFCQFLKCNSICRDMDSCFVDWDEFSTDSSTLNAKMPPGASVKCDFDLQKSSPKLEGNVEV
jgi:hypothetical protein